MSTVLTVILNWRTAEMTLRAVEAALAAMEGLEGAITVVDNASGDGSEEHLRAAVAERGWGARVRVLQAGRNGGFGAGNNVGIRAGLPGGARPDYIYILNSDAFPEPDAIRLLADHLDQNPDVGLAGGYVEGIDGTPHQTLFRFPSIASELEGAARTGPITRLFKHHVVPLPIPTAPVTRVDWSAGCSLMMRDAMLQRIGLFDETFFLYFEETELCLRAARAGWPTDYIRASKVAHIGSESTGMQRWTRTPPYWFDSRQYYFFKAGGIWHARFATLAHLTGGAIWRLRRFLFRMERRDPPYFLRDMAIHALRYSPPSTSPKALSASSPTRSQS